MRQLLQRLTTVTGSDEQTANSPHQSIAACPRKIAFQRSKQLLLANIDAKELHKPAKCLIAIHDRNRLAALHGLPPIRADAAPTFGAQYHKFDARMMRRHPSDSRHNILGQLIFGHRKCVGEPHANGFKRRGNFRHIGVRPFPRTFARQAARALGKDAEKFKRHSPLAASNRHESAATRILTILSGAPEMAPLLCSPPFLMASIWSMPSTTCPQTVY